MKYKGQLYGKVGKSYFPLEKTTDDFEALEKKLNVLEAKIRTIATVSDLDPFVCDNCGCHPSMLYRTDKGRFCTNCMSLTKIQS